MKYTVFFIWFKPAGSEAFCKGQFTDWDKKKFSIKKLTGEEFCKDDYDFYSRGRKYSNDVFGEYLFYE